MAHHFGLCLSWWSCLLVQKDAHFVVWVFMIILWFISKIHVQQFLCNYKIWVPPDVFDVFQSFMTQQDAPQISLNKSQDKNFYIKKIEILGNFWKILVLDRGSGFRVPDRKSHSESHVEEFFRNYKIWVTLDVFDVSDVIYAQQDAPQFLSNKSKSKNFKIDFSKILGHFW